MFLKVYSQTDKCYLILIFFGSMKLAVFCFGLNVYGINSAIIVQRLSFLFIISKLDGIDLKKGFQELDSISSFSGHKH